jgi:hypothetical protein
VSPGLAGLRVPTGCSVFAEGAVGCGRGRSLSWVGRGFGSLQRVEVAGLWLAYRRAGGGPPLVLLHGAYQDSRFWGRQLLELSDSSW